VQQAGKCLGFLIFNFYLSEWFDSTADNIISSAEINTHLYKTFNKENVFCEV
jgi:hypothetical protein